MNGSNDQVLFRSKRRVAVYVYVYVSVVRGGVSLVMSWMRQKGAEIDSVSSWGRRRRSEVWIWIWDFF